MASASRSSKLSSSFDALANGGATRLRRRPRAPFYIIGVLALMITGLFIAILLEDQQLQLEAMHRDVDSAALQVGARLSTLSETLGASALDIGNGTLGEKKFATIARELLSAKREVTRIEFLNPEGEPAWPAVTLAPESEAADLAVAASLQAVLTRVSQGGGALFMPLAGTGRSVRLALAMPIYAEKRFAGALVARIDLIDLMIQGVAGDASERYRMAIVVGDRTLASTSAGELPTDALTYYAALPPLPPEYRLYGSSLKMQSRFATSALVWVVIALAIAVMVALAALMRFTTRQQRIDRALLAETSLRRAMEDSLATGLRVLDPQGVIRYVNKSFCRMTGFTERELVGRAPPYPYWPDDRRQEHESKLRQILAGKVEAGGFEVVVARKDGTRFDARMYVSPLLNDARHIGWMTSMADITEPNRARNELAASRERFTTVLESLEAAVSVAARRTDGHPGDELVFGNREYLRVFGEGAAGHDRLASLQRSRDSSEVHDAATGRWFDVRTREVRWVDGRPARLQIATDITLRKVDDDVARQQQEKVQFTSRLMTIGEIVSSLAHELNQPLTAISNTTEAALARLKNRQISIDDLHTALETTSIQAQRAGGIIRRIGEFVKRSEPNRRTIPPGRLIEDAVSFAGIEAGKKGIAIASSVDPTLGPLLVDPLLIAQVLLNLLGNAIDAMEHATLRRIDLVVRRSLQEGMAEFAIIDRGSGIPDEHLGSVFEPFFSTKAEGMGMGLTICRSTIEIHQGRLTAEKNPESTGGTVMRFTLPLASGAPIEQNAAPRNETPVE